MTFSFEYLSVNLTLKYKTSFCSFMDVKKVFLAKLSGRAEYCSYARLTCCSSV